MKDFLQIASGLDTTLVGLQVISQPGLVEDGKISCYTKDEMQAAWYGLPAVRDLTLALFSRAQGTRLGDVGVFILTSGEKRTFEENYIAVLGGQRGAILDTGEKQMLSLGDVYWTRQGGKVENNSSGDLVLLAFSCTSSI